MSDIGDALAEHAGNIHSALISPPSAPSSGDLAKLVGVSCGIGTGAYLIAVAYQGNVTALWSQVKTDEHYVEFLAAIVILWALKQYGPTSTISDILLAGAALALLLKAGSNGSITNFAENIQNEGLFKALANFFNANPQSNFAAQPSLSSFASNLG
jgi:hypothetical protein